MGVHVTHMAIYMHKCSDLVHTVLLCVQAVINSKTSYIE